MIKSEVNSKIIIFNSKIRELGTQLFYNAEDITDYSYLNYFAEVLVKKSEYFTPKSGDTGVPNGFLYAIGSFIEI